MKTLPSRIWILMLGILVAVAIGMAAFIFQLSEDNPEAGSPVKNPSGLNSSPSTLFKKIVEKTKPLVLTRK